MAVSHATLPPLDDLPSATGPPPVQANEDPSDDPIVRITRRTTSWASRAHGIAYEVQAERLRAGEDPKRVEADYDARCRWIVEEAARRYHRDIERADRAHMVWQWRVLRQAKNRQIEMRDLRELIEPATQSEDLNRDRRVLGLFLLEGRVAATTTTVGAWRGRRGARRPARRPARRATARRACAARRSRTTPGSDDGPGEPGEGSPLPAQPRRRGDEQYRSGVEGSTRRIIGGAR